MKARFYDDYIRIDEECSNFLKKYKAKYANFFYGTKLDKHIMYPKLEKGVGYSKIQADRKITARVMIDMLKNNGLYTRGMDIPVKGLSNGGIEFDFSGCVRNPVVEQLVLEPVVEPVVEQVVERVVEPDTISCKIKIKKSEFKTIVKLWNDRGIDWTLV